MEEGKEESQYLTSFCRIIMPSVVRQHTLVLPKKFVDEYGDELSNTIKLELPVVVVGGDNINTCWRIGLRKSDGLLFLEDGFEEFMKWFSVGFGKFLLFKYRGNSVFNLHIFDLTAMEIDYGHGFDTTRCSRERPLQIDAGNIKKEVNDESVSEALVVRSSKRKEVNDKSASDALVVRSSKRKEVNDESFSDALVVRSSKLKEVNDKSASDALVVRSSKRKVASFAESTPTPRKKQKGILELGLAVTTPRTRSKQKGILELGLAESTPRTRKKQKGILELGLAESTTRTRSKQKGILARTEEPICRRSRRFSESHPEEETGGNDDQERGRALNAAKMYQTDNPFCIVRIIKYIITYNMMHLPTKFCEDNKNDLFGEHIDLQDSDGRS